MNAKYMILFIALLIFLLLLVLELNKYQSDKNIKPEQYENFRSLYNDQIIYYPRIRQKVVTWSPSYVDNYYQPGYNEYFYNNGYYYPVF